VTRRCVGLVLVVVVMALATAGCKKERDKKLEVKAAIDRTERLARKFVYVETTRAGRTKVGGIVEDDFRYKAQLVMNGQPVEEEVASDDALALRFLDPEQLPHFLDPARATAALSNPAPLTPGESTGASPGVVLQALSTRHWVYDKVGAPQVLGGIGGTQSRAQGEDPVVDALTALEYVRQAVDRAVFVARFSRDSVDPVWKGPEDPFPKPARGSATVRYDLKAPNLPNAQLTGGTGNQATPETAHFRKLVVYVRNRRVVEVRELIDASRKLHDLIANFKLPKDTTLEQAIGAINVVRKGQGVDAIRLRQMTLQLTDLGDPLRVDLPADAIAGGLNVVRNRGKQPLASQGGTAGGA
jgi:hypothetical protein